MPRGGVPTVEVSPGPYRAGETVAATVTVPRALDRVAAAHVELGHVDGDRWVPVVDRPLDATGGVLAQGRHLVAFQAPEDPVGRAVRWQVRLRVVQGGGDVAVDVPVSIGLACRRTDQA